MLLPDVTSPIQRESHVPHWLRGTALSASVRDAASRVLSALEKPLLTADHYPASSALLRADDSRLRLAAVVAVAVLVCVAALLAMVRVLPRRMRARLMRILLGNSSRVRSRRRSRSAHGAAHRRTGGRRRQRDSNSAEDSAQTDPDDYVALDFSGRASLSRKPQPLSEAEIDDAAPEFTLDWRALYAVAAAFEASTSPATETDGAVKNTRSDTSDDLESDHRQGTPDVSLDLECGVPPHDEDDSPDIGESADDAPEDEYGPNSTLTDVHTVSLGSGTHHSKAASLLAMSLDSECAWRATKYCGVRRKPRRGRGVQPPSFDDGSLPLLQASSGQSPSQGLRVSGVPLSALSDPSDSSSGSLSSTHYPSVAPSHHNSVLYEAGMNENQPDGRRPVSATAYYGSMSSTGAVEGEDHSVSTLQQGTDRERCELCNSTSLSPHFAIDLPPCPEHAVAEDKDAASYNAYSDDDIVTDHADNLACAVCLEQLSNGENVRLLPCGHLFHGPCAATWLAKRNACPLCQRPVIVRCGRPPSSSGASALVPSHRALARSESRATPALPSVIRVGRDAHEPVAR